jgi:hypothetical protein
MSCGVPVRRRHPGMAASLEAEPVSWCGRRGLARLLACVALTLGLIGGFAPSAIAAIDSGVSSGSSIALPAGHGEYFYVGSTSGGAPMGSLSWVEGQDLAVNAPGTANQAISIGHAFSDVGSYGSTATTKAIAGLAIDGYTVVQTFSIQHSKAAHKPTRTPEKPIKGTSLTLPFTTTSANELVVILVGGQGTGSPALSGIAATPLQNVTYGKPGSDALASAALYTAQLPAGKHKAKWRSTTYAPNSGTSLGVVAYILAPAPAPTVSSVGPDTGAEVGGTPVTITGTNLDGATAVRFGTTNASSIRVVSPTSIEAVSPGGSGTVDVTVTTERGTSTTNTPDQFSYIPPPVVTEVSPNSGPDVGGTSIMITGSNLAGATSVRFGSTAAVSFEIVSPTSIEAVSPAGTGTVDVLVTGPYGESTPTAADQFTFIPPHPVDAYSNYGPATVGHAMCRGNPGRPESMPGGTATQTFTVSAGVASLSSALVQIDPDPTVTVHLTLSVNGTLRAATEAAAAGDTHFNWPAVTVNPGDQVALSISFTATFGKIITIYSAAAVGGTLTYSNSCSDGAPSGSTTNGLRAVVTGTST